MIWKQRKLLINMVFAGSSGALAFIAFPKCEAKESTPCHECKLKRLPKANELPLYESENNYKDMEIIQRDALPLEKEVALARQQIEKYASSLDAMRKYTLDIYETGKAHSQSYYYYLAEEENKIPRILTIISGGLVGLIFARKRGIIKKTLYTSAGIGLASSVLYPSAAKHFFLASFSYIKKNITDIWVKYSGIESAVQNEEPEEFREIEKKLDMVKSLMKMEFLTSKLNEIFHRDRPIEFEKSKKDKNEVTEEKNE